MPAASELRTVAERTQAVGLLRRHAEMGACDVALLDSDGAPVAGDGALAASGVRDGARRAAVSVFDRVVGYVVARPRRGVAPGAAEEVAARGAAFLTDLCSREYELNDLSREILGAYEELNVFYDLAADLAGAPDPDAIARVVARKAASVLGAARTWVILSDRAHAPLRVAASEPAGLPGGADLADGAAARAVATRLPELIDDTALPSAGPLTARERGGRALLTVPVCVTEREDRPVLGVLQVSGDAFTSGHLKVACALASHAAALIENQRLGAVERELRLARSIQQGLLPSAAPDVPGLDVAGRCIPATNVGGDYYDHFVTAGGRLGVAVADVSGHDLAAALLQTAARATVRAQVLRDASPASVLDGTNRAVFEDLSKADMFLTAWFGTIDGLTGDLTHADAGHAPALVYRAETGTVAELSAGGPPIGVVPDGGYAEGRTRLAPGDVLLIFTDGLTEARSFLREEYGTARLAWALREAASGTAARIADAVLADIAAFDGGGPATDDRSLVVVKMRDPPSR